MSKFQFEPSGLVPDTIEEALTAWDRGEAVQSVEMGGLGQGYEMAIQCVAFELLRALQHDDELRAACETTPDGEAFPQDFLDRLDAIVSDLDAVDPKTERRKLGGLSGAQVGAAKSLAVSLQRRGYSAAREEVPDRLIFIRKQDPAPLYGTLTAA